MRFGIFTDPHYSVRENDDVRFFRSALDKVKKSLAYFQKEQVDFIICLGDLIDVGGDLTCQRQLLDTMRATIVGSGLPFYLCLGNHDVSAFPYHDFMRYFLMEAERGYYSFEEDNIHFIVLDTNYDGRGHHYTAKTMKWDELYVDEEQLRWLEEELDKTEKKVIVLTHGNLDYREHNGHRDPHVIMNYQEVQDIINKHDKVQMVLQGHCHAGARSNQNGVEYITLKALVDGPCATPVLLVTVQNDSWLVEQRELSEIAADIESAK